MKRILKNLFSQKVINNFYHLPKAVLANILYGFPTRKIKVIGITGTDGKTTTTDMVYRILKAAGKKVSMVSTINAVIGGKVLDTGFHVTSPDPFSVQKFAGESFRNGDEYLVLEVTSHALDQYRFCGIKFDVGVVTNITHEHLDYHKTFDNYINTKLKFLRDVRFAIVNSELNQYVQRSDMLLANKLFTFGLNEGDFNQKEIKLKLKIPGSYNIENALAAFGVAFALDVDKVIVRNALENFKGITGRMEEVENDKGIKIIIDFAHTPNGLQQALTSLRSQNKGKLISLIGCEGYRDVGKRSMMGKIAQKLSDCTVVTAVDPRGQLDIINKQIASGAKEAGAKMDRNFFVIDDREEAIRFAINKLAGKGDTVGIFGKGHEASMNLDGKQEIIWSDREAVDKVLNGK